MKPLDNQNQKEKRTSQRIPLSAAVTFATRGQAYEDFLIDISAGGLFIETQAVFSVGQHLSLTFPLPGHHHYIKVTGVVARISGRGIGVRFDESIQTLLEMIEDDL